MAAVGSSPSRDMTLAADAFLKKNRTLSKMAHSCDTSNQNISESGHAERESFMRKCAVYGGFEGLCVSGVLMALLSSTDLASHQILTLCFGGMFSLAIGFCLRDFTKHRADYQYYRMERDREEWELDNFPEGEVKEMVELYESTGISKADAESIVGTFSKYKKQFVDLMMVQELLITPPEGSPILSALTTFLSFMMIGSLPMMAYIGSIFHMERHEDTPAIVGPLAVGLITTAVTSGALAMTNWSISPRQNSRAVYASLLGALCTVTAVAFFSVRYMRSFSS